ncbi:MAG: hypothetical protein MI976_13055 [Pseudomonadales bacterium]|nr:hypothetical protein [Pseudomonadales bacterium]
MNQLVLLISRFLFIGLIAIIVLMAVMVGLGRQAMTHIDEFQPKIEAYLEERSGLEFSIDNLQGSWEKLSPRFIVQQLAVKSPQAENAFFSLNTLSIEINIGESFFHLRPVIELWVDGVAAELLYREGKFTLKNAPIYEDKNDSNAKESDFLEQLDLVFKQPRMQLTNSDIVIKGFWESDVSVSNINVGMASKGSGKRFWANLVLEAESTIEAVVVGDLAGQFSSPGSLNGRLYTRVDAPDLADWMPIPAKALTALEVIDASGQIQFWGTVSDGDIERVTTQLSVADVVIKHEQSSQAAPRLDSVYALGKWEGNWNDDWVLGLTELKVSGENFEWAPQQLFLKSERLADNERRLVGELDQATVSPWVSYYTSMLSDESKAYQALKAINPEAQLDNVILEVDLVGKDVADFKLSAEVTGIQTQPRRWIPGVNNVKASVLLGKYISVVDIVGDAVDLNYPALFRKPLKVDHLQGALIVRNTAEEIVIESGLLQVDDEQIQGVTQLAVIVDKTTASDQTKKKSPYLRLQATLSEFDVADLYEHLPVGVIPDGIVRWLDSSIKTGQLLRGDLLFHGPSDLYEFEPFQYVLGFTVENTQLEFLPNWRPVKDVSADVRVYSGVVDAWAIAGEYYENYVDQAWVGTQRVAPGEVDLVVDVAVNGRVENALQILVDSPIADTTAPMLEAFSATGDAETTVEVRVPFREGETADLGLVVDARVSEGAFRLREKDLVVSDVSGQLSFDLATGLSASGIKGRAFDGPIQGVINTVPDGAGQQTIIKLQGDAELEKIKPWLALEFLEPVQGQLNYLADIYLRKEAEESAIARSFIEIQSDLKDASIHYPVPLKKEVGVALPFTYKATLGGDKHYQEITLDNVFDLQLVSDDQGFERGGIGFGRLATLADPGSFSIRGVIPELDITAWLAVYDTFEQKQRLSGRAVKGNQFLTQFADSQLKINKAFYNGRQVSDLFLALMPEAKGYLIKGDSSIFKGEVFLPTAFITTNNPRGVREPIRVRLAELKLPKAFTETVSPEAGVAEDLAQVADEMETQSFNPAQLPALDLAIEQLNIGAEDYGAWMLVWKPITAGVELEKLSFDLKKMQFQGNGRWLWQKDHATTQLKGIVKTKNVSDVLTAWGYAPSLTSKSASASIDAFWPEAPYEFDLMAANANMAVVIKDGRFKDVSSGAADKVLGFLNFDDWLSRLQLKIKDLESNEMPYSEIRGQFLLQDTILKTEKLKLDGAALKIAIDGELNLKSKQIDAGLDVTIPVTRNLVLPAAAVGGLPAAATVYVIEKVLGSQLDKLTTMKYTVKGDFEDPKVALKESFNIIPKQIQESIVKNGSDKEKIQVETSSTNVAEQPSKNPTSKQAGDTELGVETDDYSDSERAVVTEPISNPQNPNNKLNIKKGGDSDLSSEEEQ